MKIFFAILLIICPVAVLSAAESNAKYVIEKARATIGADAVLNDLVTLQMRGRIEPGESKLSSAKVSITARKPCSQRLEVTVDDLLETTILEGDSGCIIRSNLSEGARGSQFRMMTEKEVQRVAFNTRQLFGFYEADSKNGEIVIYNGIEQRRGLRCHKLLYSYPNDITTTRYFAVNDHKLVSMVTDKGVESVEIGELIVNGIKFPRRIEYYQKNRRLHTLILNEVEVNKPLRKGVFMIPDIQKKDENKPILLK